MTTVRSKTRKSQQSHFSADRPITSGRDDRLSRGTFASALARRIAAWRGRESLVIALCGEWGCGKTSLKNLVIQQLHRGKKQRVDLLEFHPWEISGHGSLAEAFFRELAVTLASQADTVRQTQKRVTRLRAYAKLAAIGGTAVKIVGKAIAPHHPEAASTVEAFGQAVASAGTIATEAADAEEALGARQDGALSALKKRVAADMSALERPILITIDDIDRLTSDEIREVFQLVKANADFPNLIYLLLFDREVVSRALDPVSGDRGNDFLEKIVQVLFHVPQPSPGDVHKVLFDGLDAYLAEPGVNERWETPRWSRLWHEGLSRYFTNLRKVYRFLGSFGFQVSQMRTEKGFELNPLDLVVLETFRLFEPTFYDSLPRNRGSLVDNLTTRLLADDHDAEKRREAEVARLLLTVPDERRSRVREILEHVFPALFGHRHPGGEMLLRSLRVGHEQIFDRYFTLTISRDDVSQADLDELRESASNPKAFAEVCRSLTRRGKLASAFERLDVYKETFSESVLQSLITGLCDVADTFPETKKVSFLDFETLTYAYRLVYFALKRADESSRFALLADGLRASKGVRLPVKLASSEARRKEDEDHEFITTEEGSAQLIRLALERIRLAAEDGRLREMQGLQYVLYRWREWAEEEEPERWMNTQINTARDALWALTTFLNVLRRTSDRVEFIRYINLEELQKFVDMHVIEKWTHDIDMDNLDKDEMRALRAFRQALAWKAEGKPAGYYGSDFDGFNPLAEDS